jgi:hypothetical protein
LQRAAGRRGAGKKTALAQAFQQQIAAEVEALIGPQALDQLDFEAIETAARREALKVAAYAVAQRLNADHADHCGPSLPCACGQRARYAGRHRKTFHTALGAMTLERAYYHCTACQGGYFPRDAALGIVATSLSPALTRMIGLVGAMVSFEEGAELLVELAGIGVNAKQVERTAEGLGAQIAADECQRVEPSPEHDIAPTLYLGMDGTGVPMRAAELAGRQGKQPDGSAKTREVKLCTVWSAEGRDAEGTPVRDEGSITYSAAIESAASHDTDTVPSDFAQRVRREARRRGFEHATRQVVLGDGAAWIWNLADEYFPRAVQIVDRFHAKQHLSDVAKATTAVPATSLHNGRTSATTNSMPATSTSSSPASTAMPRTARQHASAAIICRPIATGCATMTFTPKAFAPPPASSRQAARSPSAPGSSAQACTGRCQEPTPSSHYVAAS